MNEQKKGLSPLVWVGIGCAALVVVGVIIVFGAGLFIAKKVSDDPMGMTARGIAAANPEIEFVSSDPDTRTVVFRNEKTGEKVTLDFEDVKNGNFSFETGEGRQTVSVKGDDKKGGGMTITTGEGTATFGGGGGRERIPDWVPIYPGAGVKVGLTSSSDSGGMGMIELTDWDDGEEIVDYYAEKLEDEGYKVTRNTISYGADEQVLVSGTSADQKRTVSVQWLKSGGDGKIMLQYAQK